MAISTDRDERFAAYEASGVWVDHPDAGPLVMSPRSAGVVEGVFPAGADVTVHVITAHNPGQLLSAEQNEERHQQLVADLAAMSGITVWRAVGGDPFWEHTEECVAIVGLDDEQARVLGRRHDQEAIWSWDASSLRLVECGGGSVVTLGWRVEPWNGPPPGPEH